MPSFLSCLWWAGMLLHAGAAWRRRRLPLVAQPCTLHAVQRTVLHPAAAVRRQLVSSKASAGHAPGHHRMLPLGARGGRSTHATKPQLLAHGARLACDASGTAAKIRVRETLSHLCWARRGSMLFQARSDRPRMKRCLLWAWAHSNSPPTRGLRYERETTYPRCCGKPEPLCRAVCGGQVRGLAPSGTRSSSLGILNEN